MGVVPGGTDSRTFFMLEHASDTHRLAVPATSPRRREVWPDITMFRIETTDPARLKRIATVGGGGIVLGLFLVGFNLVVPVLSGGGVGTSNLLFGLFGLLAVVFTTYPTYQAARRLDER